MWHTEEISEVAKKLDTNPAAGLSSAEADKRLKKFGPNELPPAKPVSFLSRFISQFKSTLILILLFATVLSAYLGDMMDAIAIFAIVLLNAAIGVLQESRAHKVLTSLKSKDIPSTIVIRDKHIQKVGTSEIVQGDILVLEAGEKVPADARIVESYQLSIDESILTGESENSLKKETILAAESIPLGDQANMAFKGTTVVSGRGKAIVIATGSYTEIGKIAGVLDVELDEPSPLTLELNRVGKTITAAILAISFAIFAATGLREMSLIERILITISLSVAAIPEGLPAIATITLALGVERLALKKSIVKKLHSVETLGSIRIIATDKTGTLTENKMNVTTILTKDDEEYSIEAEGYQTNGIFFNDRKKEIDPHDYKNIHQLLNCAILSTNAALKQNSNEFEIIGDTTEGALLIAAKRAGLNEEQIKAQNSRIFEMPFSQERKMMSVACKMQPTEDVILFAKGAPEVILKKCMLTKQQHTDVLRKVDSMATKGLRTLAFAQKTLKKDELKNLLESDILNEEGLEFVGIIGEKDTLRLDIRDALKKAQDAGIKTVMITGDHLSTAVSIGMESGILDTATQAVTEQQIESLSQDQLARLIEKDTYRVFARVSPLGKLRLVEAIKLIKDVRVGVTGDGVNDAPALKSAHVGIAMGSGSDIAREVADIVITDDNYATILEAIKEGRIIFDNLIKFIRYLISCNLAEVFVVTAAVIFATPLPLAPIQLLWINLITDGLPAIALGSDPPEYDVMQKPPKSQKELLHKRRWSFMISEGFFMGTAVFLTYLFALKVYDLPHAQTMAFSALAISQLVHAFNNRSTRLSIFKLGLFSNMFLVWSTLASLVMQFLVVSTALGNVFFKTTMLDLEQWTIIAVVAILPLLFVEAKKVGLRKFHVQ